MHDIIGWDIGGAHVKAARLDSSGRVVTVVQQPCPLWQGLHELERAVSACLTELRPLSAVHALTMTGELVDWFTDRQHGVQTIVKTMQQRLPAGSLRVYAGDLGFLLPAEVGADAIMHIASANWLASAGWAAVAVSRGLFVDVGSTTTDLLQLDGGQVRMAGYTDYQRLVSGELLYTGAVRTSVMAVAQRACFNGREMGLMAEHFATMADVYRLTGELHAAHDQAETADGRDKSLPASARRLSRLTGYDFCERDWPLWRDFAAELKRRQLDTIAAACRVRLLDLPQVAPLIGAGVGRFLVRQLAESLRRPYVDFTELVDQSPTVGIPDSADCAPAVAVACLAGAIC